MQLSDTVNVYPVNISVRQSVAGPELDLNTKDAVDPEVDIQIAFDQQTAAEFLPILQHFIETGGLPK